MKKASRRQYAYILVLFTVSHDTVWSIRIFVLRNWTCGVRNRRNAWVSRSARESWQLWSGAYTAELNELKQHMHPWIIVVSLLLLCFCSVFQTAIQVFGLVDSCRPRGMIGRGRHEWTGHISNEGEEAGMGRCHQFLHFKQTHGSQIIPSVTYQLLNADWSWQVAPTNVHRVNGRWPPRKDECHTRKAGHSFSTFNHDMPYLLHSQVNIVFQINAIHHPDK